MGRGVVGRGFTRGLRRIEGRWAKPSRGVAGEVSKKRTTRETSSPAGA